GRVQAAEPEAVAGDLGDGRLDRDVRHPGGPPRPAPARQLLDLFGAEKAGPAARGPDPAQHSAADVGVQGGGLDAEPPCGLRGGQVVGHAPPRRVRILNLINIDESSFFVNFRVRSSRRRRTCQVRRGNRSGAAGRQRSRLRGAERVGGNGMFPVAVMAGAGWLFLFVVLLIVPPSPGPREGGGQGEGRTARGGRTRTPEPGDVPPAVVSLLATAPQ